MRQASTRKSGIGSDDLNGNLPRQQGFEPSLKASPDQVIYSAPSARADQDPIAAVNSGVLGHQLGCVGTGVVNRQHRYVHLVANLQESAERLECRDIGVDSQLFFAFVLI